MAFSKSIIKQAWDRADGQCECRRKSHQHYYIRCEKKLEWENFNNQRRGGWIAVHINNSGGDEYFNCEIMCMPCFSRHRTFGG